MTMKRIKTTEIITTISASPELWACRMLPEGILESWLVPDNAPVEAGDPVALVRIEDCLHELMAPSRGRLQAGLGVNSVIEPGMAIGTIVRNVANN